MTEATASRKLEYAIVRNSISGIGAEVHYRFVGDIGDTIESWATWDDATMRMHELFREHGDTLRPVEMMISPGLTPLCESCKATARIDGARAFAEWLDANMDIDVLSFVEAVDRWLASESKEG